jgi:hypothetical protein
MDRRVISFLIAVSLLFSLSLFANTAAIAGNVPIDALITVESYLNSLVAGDISGMKSTLSPGLLLDKASVLDSPSYDATLRSLYANARYKIVKASYLRSGRIRVDVALSLEGDQLMEASFLLTRDNGGSYLICEELQ